jgi:hypothetical protein
MSVLPLPIERLMSVDAETQLERLLEELDEEERLLSAERRRLQDRIDYYAGPGQTGDLTELERKERELSQRRSELHARIDALRGSPGEQPQ